MKRQRPQRRQLAWRRLQPAEKVYPSAEKIAAVRADAARWEALGFDITPDKMEAILLEEAELWMNDQYVVHVARADEPGAPVRHLSIRRTDREPDMPWRDLQRIKTELAGAETEAFELFPAESRLVDTANQRWLWCMPPGQQIPVGFNDGRIISGPKEAARIGAKQARPEDA